MVYSETHYYLKVDFGPIKTTELTVELLEASSNKSSPVSSGSLTQHDFQLISSNVSVVSILSRGKHILFKSDVMNLILPSTHLTNLSPKGVTRPLIYVGLSFR